MILHNFVKMQWLLNWEHFFYFTHFVSYSNIGETVRQNVKDHMAAISFRVSKELVITPMGVIFQLEKRRASM